MSLLYRIVYAAHAKGTHHKLALDALRFLRNSDAERWQRLFLKYAEQFMTGAKAPDDNFKDFKNHVLHVRESYWGGAPAKVEEWYGTLVTALRTSAWEDAVYAAGVLSHYYTDPVMPFHTGQTEAENSIHRAAEWSINRSYDGLRAEGEAAHPDMSIAVKTGPGWLRDLVIQGAERSNPYYEKLIAHYNLEKGVVDPPAGLDSLSRKIVAELLVYAAKGYAVILDRAFEEAAVAPPDVDLALDTIMAAVKIPAKALAKRLADAEDRRAVEAMYDELKTTGRVEATLSEDDRTIRDLHEAEVAAPERARRAAARNAVMAQSAAPAPFPQPKAATAAPSAAPAVVQVEAPAATRQETPVVVPAAPAAPAPTAVAPAPAPAPERPAATVTNLETRQPAPQARVHLAATDAIERAPSIGPKLAERLEKTGIKSVADLIAGDADAIASSLDDRRITAATVESWQQQARLVMDVPSLRGGHAQLLTGAGITSKEALVAADPEHLCAAILAFAATHEGQRVLRDGNAPDIERIKSWIEAARQTRAA